MREGSRHTFPFFGEESIDGEWGLPGLIFAARDLLLFLMFELNGDGETEFFYVLDP